MVHESRSEKRRTCRSCSRPVAVCVCHRLQTTALQNDVTVTILQHSLEKKHPLNSAVIATLGLRNVDVINVSDVNFRSRFCIRLLQSSGETDDDVFDEMPKRVEGDARVDMLILEGNDSGIKENDLDGQCGGRINVFADEAQICKDGAALSRNLGLKKSWSGNSELGTACGSVVSRTCALDEARMDENSRENAANEAVETFFDENVAALGSYESTAIHFTIEKYGKIISFDPTKNASNELNSDKLFNSDLAVDELRKGFVVKKVQSKQINGSDAYEEIDEFDITVLPGSVLLFPSERSIGVEDLTFKVKNLIVLDGTWAKAKRMYKENPWLKLLPHLRLDLDELSLYGEVRHQPRAGCLSTIESIVYALRAVGEDSDGLNSLLKAFESMVGHQRRCKDERVSRVSSKF